jgi:hypothetical protein
MSFSKEKIISQKVKKAIDAHQERKTKSTAWKVKCPLMCWDAITLFGKCNHENEQKTN